MRGREWASLLGLMLGILSTSAAHAGDQAPKAEAPGAENRQAARALADRGYEHFQAGRYKDAKHLFYEAYQRFQAPTLLLMMADCHERLGELREAYETYRQVARLSPGPHDPAPYVEAHREAARRLGALATRMPGVEIHVTGAPAEDVWIMIDGQLAAIQGERVLLDPGRHVITADATGLPTVRREVVLGGNATTKVDIALGEESGNLPEVAPEVAPEADTAHRPVPRAPVAPMATGVSEDGWRSGLLWVGLGTTVALAGTGAVLAGIGSARGDAADLICSSNCTSVAALSGWQELESTRVDLLNASIWMFIGAGVTGLTTAAYGVLGRRGGGAGVVKTGLTMAPGGAGALISGQW